MVFIIIVQNAKLESDGEENQAAKLYGLYQVFASLFIHSAMDTVFVVLSPSQWEI